LIPLLLAAAAASGGAAEFLAAYPGASVILTGDGTRITHASGFEAPSSGSTPAAAALAFLGKHHAAFGIGKRQHLQARSHPRAGQPASIHVERRIDGLPVFDGDLVVGVNGAGAVTLVNGTDVPEKIGGKVHVTRQAAIAAAQAAIPDLQTSDSPKATRGWRAAGKGVIPVWRVDFAASRPSGDFRTYVSADTGKVLQRTNLRSTARPPGVAPAKPDLQAEPQKE